MNFLTPWFLAGVLAVAGPILFHLIRRAARERVPFSSLMFLKPAPPRATRRRKLEHLFLLLLRCLCLVSLACAFARPFLTGDNALPVPAAQGRQLIVLLDTSASMRRLGLWDEARAVAEKYLEQAGPADQVAVLTFDRQPRTLAAFAEWAAWPADQRAALARQRLASVSPGWMGTSLGLALTTAASQFPNTSPDGKPPARRDLVLISDLQEGAKLDGLQGHDWPPGLRVLMERVGQNQPANAGLEILDPAGNSIRLRATNSRDSKRVKFHLAWLRAGAAADIYLPPGETRTFTAPPLPAGMNSGALQLSGSETDFGNLSYYVAPQVQAVKISYLGPDSANDPAQLLYYLERVFPASPRRTVQLAPGGLSRDAAFAVIPGPLAPDDRATLRDWLKSGQCALLVLSSIAAGPTLASLLGLPDVSLTEAAGDYALLGEIDFKHPLFAPFDDPRFSDFTHIHFWKHRRWDIPPSLPARLLAKFDDGSPALAQIPLGKGHLLVLASGWTPADSQLAVSSKFPPLMETMLDWSGAGAPARAQFRTGDALPSPVSSGGAVHWQKPDGRRVKLPAGTDFVETDLPGIYSAAGAGKARRFAVNLPLEETRTAPLSLDELGRLGVPLGPPGGRTRLETRTSLRHLQDAEVENRQKIWRWLIVAALAITLGEVIWSGWLARRLTTAATP